MSQHVAFWKKMLYFPPEKEIRVKTISALFTYRAQSRLHSIFFSVLLLRDSFMWMGFITLQQTSGVLLFKLKFQAHFLVVSHTWEFIFLPSGTCFHFLSFFFFFSDSLLVFLSLNCPYLYWDIPAVGLLHIGKEHICSLLSEKHSKKWSLCLSQTRYSRRTVLFLNT